jgi:glucoside 3-dehydrogenase (cytochrome c) hitch-hiker subunit
VPHDRPDLSRRDALKLAASLGAAVLMPRISADAVAAAHQAVAARKAGAPLKVLTPSQHHAVDVLTELIIPADDRSPGASAARVADYIDFALSESPAQARQFWVDGLAALDAASTAQFGSAFATAAPDQQMALLTELAAHEFSPATPLERFFHEAKSTTIFGYYTSQIGIRQELQYKGNQYLAEFVGCTHPEHQS